MLTIFDEVALVVILIYYPAYERIHSEVHVRITDLPLSSSLRDLRRSHLNTLVRVSGVVTRRTGVFPQLKYVKFDCRKCGAVLGPFYQDPTREYKISYCPECQGKGPFSVNSEQVCWAAFLLHFGSDVSADGIPELSEADAAGVARLCASRSPTSTPRGRTAVGPHRQGKTWRRDREFCRRSELRHCLLCF